MNMSCSVGVGLPLYDFVNFGVNVYILVHVGVFECLCESFLCALLVRLVTSVVQSIISEPGLNDQQ